MTIYQCNKHRFKNNLLVQGTIGIIKKTKTQIELNEDKEHKAISISFVRI